VRACCAAITRASSAWVQPWPAACLASQSRIIVILLSLHAEGNNLWLWRDDINAATSF
jgi:hypothetical protein